MQIPYRSLEIIILIEEKLVHQIDAVEASDLLQLCLRSPNPANSKTQCNSFPTHTIAQHSLSSAHSPTDLQYARSHYRSASPSGCISRVNCPSLVSLGRRILMGWVICLRRARYICWNILPYCSGTCALVGLNESTTPFTSFQVCDAVVITVGTVPHGCAARYLRSEKIYWRLGGAKRSGRKDAVAERDGN